MNNQLRLSIWKNSYMMKEKKYKITKVYEESNSWFW